MENLVLRETLFKVILYNVMSSKIGNIV